MTGSCLCGEIEFEVDEIPGMVFNCHCSRCRKAHGAAFATQAFAVRSNLRSRPMIATARALRIWGSR